MVKPRQSFEVFLRAATRNQCLSSEKGQNCPRTDRCRMEMGPRLFNRCDRNVERPQLASPSKGKLICHMYSHIKAFEVRLALLVGIVQNQDFKSQSLSAEKPVAPFPAEKSVEALEMLKAEFDVRFRELHVHAKEIRLFQNPWKPCVVISLSWLSYRTVMF